jgi:5'(3')-deoxyribonucleotidase
VTRPVVQFDVDGVLADFMSAFTRRAKTLGNADKVTGTREQQTWEAYGVVDPKHVATVWQHIKTSDSFWSSVPPLVDREIFCRVNELQDSADIYFATARGGQDAKWQTIEWLADQGIANPTVVLTPNKGDTARALRATYAIDDKAGNAIYTAYAAPKTKSYIIDRVYNRFDHNVVGSPVIRVATVGEFLNDIEKESAK